MEKEREKNLWARGTPQMPEIAGSGLSWGPATQSGSPAEVVGTQLPHPSAIASLGLHYPEARVKGWELHPGIQIWEGDILITIFNTDLNACPWSKFNFKYYI